MWHKFGQSQARINLILHLLFFCMCNGHKVSLEGRTKMAVLCGGTDEEVFQFSAGFSNICSSDHNPVITLFLLAVVHFHEAIGECGSFDMLQLHITENMIIIIKIISSV